MNGMKLALSGSISTPDPDKLVVDSEHPLWMCNLRAKPKHYGLLRARIASLAPGTARNLLTINHLYKVTPSFIVGWYYPQGTDPGRVENQTYGLGSFSSFYSGSNLLSFTCRVDSGQFIIEVENGSPITMTNLYAEFNFLIFAQGFPLLS